MYRITRLQKVGSRSTDLFVTRRIPELIGACCFFYPSGAVKVFDDTTPLFYVNKQGEIFLYGKDET